MLCVVQYRYKTHISGTGIEYGTTIMNFLNLYYGLRKNTENRRYRKGYVLNMIQKKAARLFLSTRGLRTFREQARAHAESILA